jgi:two-component system chemotaxis response regulator CheY
MNERAFAGYADSRIFHSQFDYCRAYPRVQHSTVLEFVRSLGEMMKVLVADDSGVMRKIIIRSLNAVGVSDVVEAANGQEAIDAYKNIPVDLILTDWNMPVKSGLDVVTEIRATGSSVPIIMITTEAQKSQVIAAIQAGVNDYLTKPFEADDLREKLDKFVTV